MNTDLHFKSTDWALILGASSGFGGATAIELARHGMNICGVHFDRSTTMHLVEHVKKEIAKTNVKSIFFNVNAADANNRKQVFDALTKELGQQEGSSIRVLMHSLAFGTLKPYIAENPADMVTQAQMEMTIDVMANSLVYWVQSAYSAGILKKGSRIYAMTSSGGRTQIPHYGAVSAAKATLESHIRQLNMELGEFGITANSVMAGATRTPAQQKIPGADKMLQVAKAKNPMMRITTPEDIAKSIVLFTHEYADFLAGNVIGVDGGEETVSYIGQKNAREME